MTSITVTINLDEMGEENEEGELVLVESLQDTIQADIVRQLTDKVIRGYDYKGLENGISQRVNDAVDALVKEKLTAVLNGPITITDRWNGEPTGEVITIAGLAQKAFEKYIKAPARDSFNRNANNMGELVEDAVKGILAAELKPAIAEAKKQMTDEVVKRALAGAVSALAPVVR